MVDPYTVIDPIPIVLDYPLNLTIIGVAIVIVAVGYYLDWRKRRTL